MSRAATPVFRCLTANGVVMKDEAGTVVHGYHFPMLIIVLVCSNSFTRTVRLLGHF